MAEVLINDFRTTLVAQVAAGGTSMILQSGDGVILRTKGGAGNTFRVKFQSVLAAEDTGEIVLVTIPASGDVCTIARQQEGTSASPTMAVGAIVTAIVTSAGLQAWLVINARPSIYPCENNGASPGASATANTTAIQAALTAAHNAGGGAVTLITPGTYQVNDTLIIGSNCRFTLGKGVIIQLVTSQIHKAMIQNTQAVKVTTLSAPITSTGALTLTVVSSANYYVGSLPFTIRIEDEWMSVTAVSGTGNTIWTVTRAFLGSTAATHLNGTQVMSHLNVVRDTNIVLEGGSWDAQNNNTDWHTILLNNADYVVVRDTTILNSSKYAFLGMDVSNVRVENIDLLTYSDGIHFIGPASFLNVKNIRGQTGDDFVSLTSTDYNAYDLSGGGTISNWAIDTLQMSGTTPSGVKVTGAAGYTVTTGAITNIQSSLSIPIVQIVDDAATGPGGAHFDDIIIRGISDGSGYVNLSASHGGSLQMVACNCALQAVGASASQILISGSKIASLGQHFVDVESCTIADLSLENCSLNFSSGGTSSLRSVVSITGSGNSVDKLRMNNVSSVGGGGPLIVTALATDIQVITSGCHFKNFNFAGGGLFKFDSGAGRTVNWTFSDSILDVATGILMQQFSGNLNIFGAGLVGPLSSGNNGWFDREGGVLRVNNPTFRVNGAASNLGGNLAGDVMWNDNVGGLGWSGPGITAALTANASKWGWT